MGNLVSIFKSGAESLYIRSSNRNVFIEKVGTETIISIKIKKVSIQITYDNHATSQFTLDEIMGDFWSMVLKICEENGIEWR